MSTTFLKKYKVLSQIGEGSFSEVLKCQERETGNLFAAKRLKKDYHSLAEVTESPEVIAMRKLSHHPNILHIIEFHVDPIPGKVTFIFELMEMSLYDMMKNRKRPLPELRVKRYLYQLLKGLDHLHHHGIFHRDIKPENILIKNEIIKLADLGSIRGAYSRPPYTEYISTRWYRSPECLLTTGYYGPKMDVWACGCVFYELLTTKPLFPGTNEVDQITKIHDVLGTPNTRLLAKFYRHKSRNCEYFFQAKTGSGLSCLLTNLTDNGRDILKQMLTYDPEHRINVRRLLEHRYFNDLREQEPILLKKPVPVSQSFTTKEWRNPLLLSLITSGEKKKKTKLLKKRTAPQKSLKQNTISTQSLRGASTLISGSSASKTLPLLCSGNQEKSLGSNLSKMENYSSKKLDKLLGAEEQLSMRSWVSSGKISHTESKSESRPMKRKPSSQLPKVCKVQQQSSNVNVPSFQVYESQPKEYFDFGSVTLPNINQRRSDHMVQRRLQQINNYSSKINVLTTIPERGKTYGVRGESPSDSSSAEGIIKKPRGM
ncbi:mitogen-activated protein kinase ERK-A, putative [Pediculus humanus corporis]|uniref:Mitogen-activated protein kinase ERK-A, putative n=1 Tax=Pediculus humanus subsp. corporis TaxID=121224 RepID=E0VPE5_PEDHC|nr:mitogen-activated protein kinase ERK-A, putative [Pediculus humanus corporis]EEB15251.1 mitogen-activated protein kinase ERK-A, putative [Pediculus humanus corporis]